MINFLQQHSTLIRNLNKKKLTLLISIMQNSGRKT